MYRFKAAVKPAAKLLLKRYHIHGIKKIIQHFFPLKAAFWGNWPD